MTNSPDPTLDELLRDVRSATPEELTAQRESYGKNYKPGPRQATPFTPERIGDHINCPKHGLKFGFCEECVGSPEELPPLAGQLYSALDRLRKNAQRIFDAKSVRDWCETLAEADAALEAYRTDSDRILSATLPVPERTAEMDELMGKMRAGAEAVIAWKQIKEPTSLKPLFDFSELTTPENVLLLLDHFAGKPK